MTNMEFPVLNTNFEFVGVLDTFSSFIWTDRFNTYGDFELSTEFNDKLLNLLVPDYYILNKESEHVMIIEDIEITSDIEQGATLRVTGRSLESILDRRIVWKQTTVNGTVETNIQKLFNENIIDPEDENRTIENFIFETANDYIIDTYSFKEQFTGDNLYDIITQWCADLDMGFKITLDDNFNFVFKLFKGVDHTSRQENRRKVIFSQSFDNLYNTQFKSIKSTYKTMALVAGEGEGNARKKAETGDLSIVGLDRRELFVDARDISTKDENGNTISAANYTDMLEKRGDDSLAENSLQEAVDGDTDTKAYYIYGEDYALGDLVELKTEYGMSGIAKITEMIFSYSDSGMDAVPTFEMIADEQYYDSTTVILTPKMTGRGNLTTTGKVTGSDWLRSGNPENYNYDWWKAFDQLKTTYWATKNADLYAGKVDWVQFAWPNGEKVMPLSIEAIGGRNTNDGKVKRIEVYFEDDNGNFVFMGAGDNKKKAKLYSFKFAPENPFFTNKVKIMVYSLNAKPTGLREVSIYGRR